MSSKLNAIITVGPALAHKELSSPSTGRAPYIQDIDLGPTALAILGKKAPASMVGQPATTVARQGQLAATISSYKESNSAAQAHVWIASRFFTVMSIVAALAMLGLSMVIVFRWQPRPVIIVAAVGAGLLPTASLLVHLVPWWRASSPGTAIIGATAGALIVLTGISFAGPWRRSILGPPLVAAALTTAILTIDVLTGSHLQLNSPLGYDAIVAGRFSGFGNLTFSMFAATTMLLVAAGCRLADGAKARVFLIVGSCAIATIALTGAPAAGSDFGGVISLVPAMLILALIAANVRVSATKLILGLLGGAVVVMAIAFADYLRPADSQTHLGRFVGQLLDGSARTVINRKLQANLGLLTKSVFTLLTILLIVMLIVLLRDRHRAVQRSIKVYEPYALAAVVSIAIVTIVGFAVNDSGVALIGGSTAVVVPLLLCIVSRHARDNELVS
ncbi:MAG: hypothetical protein ABI137_12870 [Antricoccus sp.]